MTAFSSEGKVAGAGLQSLGAATKALNSAKADLANAETKASATQFGGMMDMFGGLGAAGISQFGAGAKWSDATDIGFAGNQVDKNGRLRY